MEICDVVHKPLCDPAQCSAFQLCWPSCSSLSFPAPGPLLWLFPLPGHSVPLYFPRTAFSPFRLIYIRKKRIPLFQSSPLVSNYLCSSVYPLPIESVHESKDLLFWLLYAQHLAFSWYSTNICWISEWSNQNSQPGDMHIMSSIEI